MSFANPERVASCGEMNQKEKVRKLMMDRGLNQNDLAEMAGASKQKMSDYLWKKAGMKPHQLLRLARGLGVDLEYLVDDDMTEPREMRLDADADRVIWAMRVLGLNADDVLRSLKIAASAVEPPKANYSTRPDAFHRPPDDEDSSGRGRKSS